MMIVQQMRFWLILWFLLLPPGPGGGWSDLIDKQERGESNLSGNIASKPPDHKSDMFSPMSKLKLEQTIQHSETFLNFHLNLDLKP